ncbi:MAG: O-antigen ligase family protein [Candidatus Pacebacteria bacterium]|nr:O-antigen ligase family protein [Candidatus Paceibacterota bacterium]
MEILIALYLVIYLVLTIFRPRLALLFLIFALPSYLIRFNIFQIPLTLLETQIIISFLAWFFKNYKGLVKNLKQKLPKKLSYPFRNEIILWLIVAFLAVIVSNFSPASLGILKAYFIEPIMLFILIINYFFKQEDWQKITWALTFSALLVSIVSFYQYFTGDFIFNSFWSELETRRAVSVFGYPNAVGLYLAPIAILTFSLTVNCLKKINFKKNKKQILYLVVSGLSFLLSILAIYFAKSDGALIALSASIFLFLIFYNKNSRLIISVLTSIFIIFLIIYPSYISDIKNKLLLQDKSGQIRLAQWSETYQMMKTDNNWLTGSGLSNYQKKVSPYHQEGIFVKDYNDPKWLNKVLFNDEFRKKAWQPLEIYLYPHNIFLNFWTELGLLGLIVFLAMVIKYYQKSILLIRKNFINKSLALGLLGAMTVIFIHGLVDVPYFKNDLSALFWLFLALLSIHIIKYRYGKNTSN